MTLRSVRLLAIVGCGALALYLPGCQKHYTYDVRGTVKSVSDGSPLVGVRIRLGAGGPAFFNTAGTTVTGADGSFALRFSVGDVEFMGRGTGEWPLVLAKEGYVEEVIDLNPAKEPDSTSTPTQMIVVAFMRKVEHETGSANPASDPWGGSCHDRLARRKPLAIAEFLSSLPARPAAIRQEVDRAVQRVPED